MNLEIRNKVALVTGGARGIGEAICRSLSKEGAQIIVLDRNREAGQALESSLRAEGGTCTFLEVDLADEDACREAILTTLERYHHLDILVHNAGVNDGKDLDSGLAAFRASLEANLMHVYALTHFAKPALCQSRGCIVNVSSKVAETGQGGTSGYAAAKGAMNALTREWAVDLRNDGVRVNAVCPAEVWTPMYENWLASMPNGAEMKAHIESKVPLGQRFTSAEEIADTVVFLASPRSGHTTGQILYVDGGYTHLDRKL